MIEDKQLISALAATCYVVENQIDDDAARKVWYRHCDDSSPAEGPDNNYIGGLLREAGVASTSMNLSPSFVQMTVTDSLRRLCAVLVQLRHPDSRSQKRWLVAYGMGPDGLWTMVALEPNERSLERTELWPNVTGQIVVIDSPAPHAMKIEIVELSADMEE